MSNIILPRRKFLAGMASLFAAPAIVRFDSIMPVKAAAIPPIIVGPGCITWTDVPRFVRDHNGRIIGFSQPPDTNYRAIAQW